jgi:hypothetical protein
MITPQVKTTMPGELIHPVLHQFNNERIHLVRTESILPLPLIQHGIVEGQFKYG